MGAEPFAGRELKVREIVGGLDEKPYPPRQTLEHWADTLRRWCAETSVRRGPGHRDGRRGMIST